MKEIYNVRGDGIARLAWKERVGKASPVDFELQVFVSLDECFSRFLLSLSLLFKLDHVLNSKINDKALHTKLVKVLLSNSKLKTQHFFCFSLQVITITTNINISSSFSFSSSLLSLSPSLFLVLNVQRMPRRKAHTVTMTQYSPFLLSLDPSFWDFNETYKVKVKHKSEDERGHQTGYHFKDISITKGFFIFLSKTLSPYIGLSQSLPHLNP